jgi:hypothetical protein
MIRLSLMLILLAICAATAHGDEVHWKAGVASVNITPELPIWLSGFAARNKPATDKLDDLWAKALALESADGQRAVLVTIDLVGIDRDLSREVCRRIEERYKLPRSAVALNVSHTHSGPVVGENLAPMYSLDQQQTDRITRYTRELIDKLVGVAGKALNSLEPARLSYAVGKATFAVNRRNNPEGEVHQRREANALVGPVDHDVPVLLVHSSGEDETLRAIVCGYACHATVLDDYFVSGDWPGVAQNELQRRRPGTTVMFWAGCGADQNPVPRRSVGWLNAHGNAFADAVDAALAAQHKPIAPKLKTAYDEIGLPFASLPTREELASLAAGGPPRAAWAKYLLEIWDREGNLPQTYPYPVQVWQLGEEVRWLFLGGEVVVDFSLRLKKELGRETTWVAGYSNDVMGYIPSKRVLTEGGYEGGDSRWYYGLPAPWAPEVEEKIVDAVQRLVAVRTSSRAEEQ